MTRDLGRVGASVGLTDLTDAGARELEQSGYGALWVGASVAPDLIAVERILAATESVAVVTAITTIWSATPAELADSFHRVHDRFGDRFIFGLGTAHPGLNAPLAHKPLQAMTETLAALEGLGVPADSLLLAALGPRMLQLAGQRTLGAHPYLAPASTTADARLHVGESALLAQALLVVITDNDSDMLAIGRKAIKLYLTLPNYQRNFLRAGFTESDLQSGGSERLVRALVASTATVAAAVGEHLDAGADHVTIGIRPTADQDVAAAYRRTAELLQL
jgi:probable F420-dependent oxidoreductase